MKASTISGAINSALPTGVSSRGVVSEPPPEWNLIPEPRSKSHSLTLNICRQYMSKIYWEYMSIPGWADRCTHRAHSQVWGPCVQFLSSGGTPEQRRRLWWSLPPLAPWKTSWKIEIRIVVMMKTEKSSLTFAGCDPAVGHQKPSRKSSRTGRVLQSTQLTGWYSCGPGIVKCKFNARWRHPWSWIAGW